MRNGLIFSWVLPAISAALAAPVLAAGPVSKPTFKLMGSWSSGHDTLLDRGETPVGDDMDPANAPLCRRILRAVNVRGGTVEAAKAAGKVDLPPGLAEKPWLPVTALTVSPVALKEEQGASYASYYGAATASKQITRCAAKPTDESAVCRFSTLTVDSRAASSVHLARGVFTFKDGRSNVSFWQLDEMGRIKHGFQTYFSQGEDAGVHGIPGFRVFSFEGADYLGHWSHEDFDFSDGYAGRGFRPRKTTFEVGDLDPSDQFPIGMKICVFSLTNGARAKPIR